MTIKSLLSGLVLVLLLASCDRKEYLFEKTFRDTWNIDYIESYGIETDLTGTVTFSKKKSDFTSTYAVTNDFYKGEFNYSDGRTTEFSYEYFQILSNEDIEVNIWINDEQLVPIQNEMLTRDTWIFTFTDQAAGVTASKYHLSK